MAAQGSEILEAIADAYLRLRNMAWQLRSKPEVKDTGIGMDIFPCTDPHCIPLGMYAEATLWHDEPICWSLDLTWFDVWTILTSVSFGTGANIHKLVDLEDQKTDKPEDVPELIRSAAADLVATADSIDFASLPPLPPERWTIAHPNEPWEK